MLVQAPPRYQCIPLANKKGAVTFIVPTRETCEYEQNHRPYVRLRSAEARAQWGPPRSRTRDDRELHLATARPRDNASLPLPGLMSASMSRDQRSTTRQKGTDRRRSKSRNEGKLAGVFAL